MTLAMRTLMVFPPLLAVVALAGCGGSPKPHGYLDADRLSKAITEQVNQKLRNPTLTELEDLKLNGVDQGDSVDRVICIQSTLSKREFNCKMNLNSGYSENITILVSKDGNSWISE